MNNDGIQDALITIHRNQQQIDLLTANNTQLINYLLHLGLSVPQIQMPRLALLPPANPFPNMGVPDQPDRPKRGRPRKVQQIEAPAPERHSESPQWSPQARAKRAATVEANRRANTAPRWTPAQRAEIGERSRKMWAARRKEAKRQAAR